MMGLVENSSLQENCQTVGSSGLEQNSLVERHGPMEIENRSAGSDGKESCLITEFSSPKHNELGEKHELGYENQHYELMGTKSIGSDAPGKCQPMESSSPKQIRLLEEHEVGSEHVPSEPMKTIVVGSDTQENCLLAECSYLAGSSIPESNYLGETRVIGAEHVNNKQNSLCENQQQMMESFSPKPDSLGKEHAFGSENEPNGYAESRDIESNVRGSFLIEKCLSPNQNKLEEKHEFGFENLQSEPINSTEIGSDAQEKCQVTESSSLNRTGLVEKHEVGTEDVEGKSTESKFVGSDSIHVELTPDASATKNSNRTARKEKSVPARSRKRKYMLRSSTGNSRILRSRSQSTSKPPGSSTATVNVSDVGKNKRKRRKMKKAFNSEYSRLRKRLRYLLNRMGYEHSLIDAYSGDGWKGQSIEKIKPEKELQRATSEILRCKRKFRDLFQHLDSLCAEGRLQESLFDSEGQICSEDIFCAKCGSKNLTADNDIILCDGICDRGFHQMCLEPPLLKEEIPPGDEGWLCPGCDCKVDCIDLLNDFQGTDLSIDDNWEKVFPEAAATAAGNTLDENFGFPSDDSEDNDYDPDGPEVVGSSQTEGLTSEESDFTSSDELIALPVDEQYLGLPSDDSEDDDYDPNAPDLNENVNKESSSSDFTSDPETFSASSCDNGTSGGDQVPMASPINGDKLVSGLGQRKTKIGRNKKQSLNAEILSLQEPDLQGPLPLVSGKRRIERLDYKKLHDETYGNVSSDSSDDEDWTDADAQKKRENDGSKKESGSSPKETSPTAGRKTVASGRWWNSKRAKSSPKKRARQKLEFDGANSSAAETQKDGSLPDCTGKKATASGSRRLGDNVTERLLESLRENEYPSRDMKESLAKELGITPQQVSKWFENARWSLRHSVKDDASGSAKASSSKETATQQSRSPKIRNKRNHKLDDKNHTNVEVSAAKNKQTEETLADSPKSRTAQTRRQNNSREVTRLTIQTRQRRMVIS